MNRSEIIFEDQLDVESSSAYNHTVKYSRPSTIKIGQQRSHLCNSISLISTVELSSKAYNRQSGADFGVYTLLSVKTSPDSNNTFRVGRQVVNIPSFMVRIDSWKHIDFSLTSPFGGGRLARVKRRKQKAAAKKSTGGDGEEDEE